MDLRIGKLIRDGAEVFYTFIDGNYVEGSQKYIEQLLGVSKYLPKPVVYAEYSTYTVHLTFEYPAWDEVDGYYYREISATSKSDAVRQARRMARDDGHAVGGRGKYWFKAEEEEQK